MSAADFVTFWSAWLPYALLAGILAGVAYALIGLPFAKRELREKLAAAAAFAEALDDADHRGGVPDETPTPGRMDVHPIVDDGRTFGLCDECRTPLRVIGGGAGLTDLMCLRGHGYQATGDGFIRRAAELDWMAGVGA